MNQSAPSETGSPTLPPWRLIWAVVWETAVREAAFSLLGWGAVNLTASFYLEEGIRTAVSKLAEPDLGVLIVAYAGAILGLVMLTCGLFAAIAKHSIAVLLEALMLALVGAWNVAHPFVILEVLRPYGLVPKGGGIGLPLVLGICQLGWALNSVLSWRRLRARPEPADRAQKREARNQLMRFVSSQPDPACGRVKVQKAGEILGITHTTRYTAQLYDRFAVFVQDNLRDAFQITKENARKRGLHNCSPGFTFSPRLSINSGENDYFIEEPSYTAFKNWAFPPDQAPTQE
ncbi:MAG: hypothetical protein FJ291_05270 [Planctomycetes bacterium]|nr:hypothetical protein [Planctomycetota bacterium]